MSTAILHNRTRQSASLTGKLRRQGRWLEIPLLHILRQSDLAREGLENSGSYRFADHIYRNQPSGRGAIGTLLDRALMALPAVRSFRNRHLAARDELVKFLVDRAGSSEGVDVLSVPCGLPRELADAAHIASRLSPGCLENVRFHGLDLDERVLSDAADFAASNNLPRFSVHHGNALDHTSYPLRADFITCTGLAEFLDDVQLGTLYGIFRDVLKPGGRLFTTGMRRLSLSDYLLELAELHTHYRSPSELEQLARSAGFTSVEVRFDELKIQSLMVAGHAPRMDQACSRKNSSIAGRATRHHSITQRDVFSDSSRKMILRSRNLAIVWAFVTVWLVGQAEMNSPPPARAKGMSS